MNKFIENIEWKNILFLAVFAIILQDIIIERIIPLVFMNNAIDSDYLLFMQSAQFLIYICLAFYLCRIIADKKILNLTVFIILASLISSILVFIIYTSAVIIQSLPIAQIVNVLLLSLYNLSLVFSLIIPAIIGYLSEKIYLRLIPEETPFFMKLFLPIAVVISLLTVIPAILFPGFDIFLLSFSGAPLLPLIILAPVWLAIAYLASMVPFLASGFFGQIEFQSPLTLLWIFISYYTLFLFFAGYFYMRFKETRHVRWIFVIALMIILHLICAGIMFMGFALGGG